MDFYQYFGGWHEAQVGGRDFHHAVNEVNGEDYKEKSATGMELLDVDDPTFIHRKEHLEATRAQGEPEIMRAYARMVFSAV